MEKWDLYNAKREKSGITVCRGEIIPKGLYHLSVSVWIVNQQGQYLLSQRHPKKQYPLYWECTGGSVLSGETSLQGAIREVKEELGILLTPGSEKLIYQSRRENVQDFYDVWLFHKNIKIEEMRLQETEVVDIGKSKKKYLYCFDDCTCQRIAICYCPLWLWGYAGNAEPQPKNSADYVSCDF